MSVIYKDNNWEIYERGGNLRITLFENNQYVKELCITPEMMKSKLLELIKQLPEEVWEVKENKYW